MTDGIVRRAIKTVTRFHFDLNVATSRALKRWRGERPYLLRGACQGCASCCESPSMHVGRLTWHFRPLRWLFLTWHEHVNGFELVRTERPRAFVFRCGHFDIETRRCDSYDSRPGMCRDYPRALLHQSWPELFTGCGYRPLSPDAARLRRELEARELPEEQLVQLRRRLYLE